MLEIVSLNPVAYTPTVALGSFTGATRPLVRGQNMFLRGNSAPYLGVYLGSNDLGETIPTIALTGTIAFTAGSFALVGTGTAFLTELHIGQLIFAATEVLSVKSVTDDENAVLYRAPETTASGQTGELPAGLFAVNDKRGTAIWGNAHELDQGSILGVGQGDLRLDGAVLPGGGLTLERTPRLAFYDEATGDYDVFDLGMDVPAAPTVNVVAGGTRGMVAAEYSLRIAPARKRPKGKAYGNASDPTSFTLSAAGDRPEIDFPAMDTAHGQNAWRVYGTLSTVQQFNQPPINGPWYYIREVTDDDVSPADRKSVV